MQERVIEHKALRNGYQAWRIAQSEASLLRRQYPHHCSVCEPEQDFAAVDGLMKLYSYDRNGGVAEDAYYNSRPHGVFMEDRCVVLCFVHVPLCCLVHGA